MVGGHSPFFLLIHNVLYAFTEFFKRFALVDEFQDTDPIQTELINKICIKDGEYIPGLLFVVGDVKQSIYRFRLADPHIFLQHYNEFPETDAAPEGESAKVLL